ncbi:hypothetical protein C8034_v005080 [Colletotrichum sidae]|uniref:GPI-anchored protein n=1 Tax=Colletotrichum sidae TaxID=1347389 RepID=A0A4R8S5C8_9PEZI|nr:hypothetical protein C8034_v005080 [Colletotrichum sidae]
MLARYLALAAASLAPAAAQSPTKTERTTMWLPPPRSTGVGENIYASVITAAPSSTEYLLACTSVWRSASACSHFSGVTLTYGNNTMKIGFRTETFDCKRGPTATCSVSAPGTVDAQSVLAGSESARWFTAMTIVDGHDKLKTQTSSSTTTPAAAATTTSANGNGVCKRATKPKTGGSDGDDGCSAASNAFGGLPLVMAGAAAVLGVVVTLFL